MAFGLANVRLFPCWSMRARKRLPAIKAVLPTYPHHKGHKGMLLGLTLFDSLRTPTKYAG